MRTKTYLSGLLSLIGLIICTWALSTSPAGAIGEISTTPIISPTTPAQVVKLGPDKPSCTQHQFRKLVKKIYAKKKISAADHEALYQARRCLKHPGKALRLQHKLSAERKIRLDPWGYAWSKVPAPTKSMLARLKFCESGGSYTAVNSSGHGGAYQYDWATWQETGGSGYAQNAPPREQDVRTARFWPGHQSRWDASRHCWG